MQNLFILYSALAAFGIGVTIVDLFGVFDHFSGSASSGHDGDGAHDGDSAHHDSDGDGAHDSGDHTGSHDIAVSHGSASANDDSHTVDHYHADHASHTGSYVASADSGTKVVAKTLGALRSGVYFSLGAGPTGLFALLTGVNAVPSLLWSAGAGVFILVFSRALRSFIRKDLDSSLKPEEFLMEPAVVSVSVQPGAMGKVIVRHSDRETELYVRAKDPALELKKGRAVRITDYNDDCYWIEPEL